MRCVRVTVRVRIRVRVAACMSKLKRARHHFHGSTVEGGKRGVDLLPNGRSLRLRACLATEFILRIDVTADAFPPRVENSASDVFGIFEREGGALLNHVRLWWWWRWWWWWQWRWWLLVLVLYMTEGCLYESCLYCPFVFDPINHPVIV